MWVTYLQWLEATTDLVLLLWVRLMVPTLILKVLSLVPARSSGLTVVVLCLKIPTVN